MNNYGPNDAINTAGTRLLLATEANTPADVHSRGLQSSAGTTIVTSVLVPASSSASQVSAVITATSAIAAGTSSVATAFLAVAAQSWATANGVAVQPIAVTAQVVTAPSSASSDGSGIGTGAIVGIVIGAVAVVGIICAVVHFRRVSATADDKGSASEHSSHSSVTPVLVSSLAPHQPKPEAAAASTAFSVANPSFKGPAGV